MGFAPDGDRPQQLFGELLVADEVVIDEEDLRRAQTMAFFDFGHDLRNALHPRAPAVDDDDVAELAVERAAARELDRHRVVLIDLDEIEPRRRRGGEVGLVGGTVFRLVGAACEIGEELRPRLLRLVDEQHVGLAAQLLRAERRVGTADDDEAPAAAELGDDLEHPFSVDDVAGHADDVGLEVEVDVLDVLVTQYDLVVAWRHPRHRRHREVRKYAAFSEAREDTIVGPEALRILRSDQVDPHGTPFFRDMHAESRFPSRDSSRRSQ